MANYMDITKELPTGSPIKFSDELSLPYKQYQILDAYLASRIKYASQITDERAVRMDEIDRQLLGSICLKGKDIESASKNREGKSPKVTDINLALGQAQIDTAVTAIMDMLVPTDKMYEPFGPSETQSEALALTDELNKQAERFNHIGEYFKVFSDIFRYNLGGCLVKWERVMGNRLGSDPLGGSVVSSEPSEVFAGNRLIALDMRNTFYDPTVDPDNLSLHGSYAGYTRVYGISQLNEMIDSGELNIEYINDGATIPSSLVTYNERPSLHTPVTSETGNRNRLDWLFNTNIASPDKLVLMTKLFAKIRPIQFGLGESNKMQIWEFTYLGTRLVGAKLLDNAHGRLPIVLATATADSLGTAMVGFSETLIPLQNFASYLINAKQRAYRKQLYGVTVYDKNKIDMRQIVNTTRNNDFENAYVPVDLSENGNIANVIRTFNDAPDTSSTMTDLANIKTTMQDLLPTDSRQMLGNLSRVSQWQAQRTVRETDKRTIKIARLLNASVITPILFMSVYNVLQYKDSILVRESDGSVSEVSLAGLRESDIEFRIVSALRGIDKDLASERLRDIINSLLQVPNLSSDLDILELVRYWSTMMGVELDLAQFKVKSPFDKLTPEQKQGAYALLMQQAREQQLAESAQSAPMTVDLNQTMSQSREGLLSQTNSAGSTSQTNSVNAR